MLSRTIKSATSRLTQISNQLSPQARTMATLNTKLPLNTGAEIRMFARLKSSKIYTDDVFSQRPLASELGKTKTPKKPPSSPPSKQATAISTPRVSMGLSQRLAVPSKRAESHARKSSSPQSYGTIPITPTMFYPPLMPPSRISERTIWTSTSCTGPHPSRVATP